MSIKPESGQSDDGRIRKIAWTAGGVAAAGTAGLIVWEMFHHRPPTTPEEALTVFTNEDTEYHLPSVQIMDVLLRTKSAPNKYTCASFEDLLEVTGYKDGDHRELDRIIKTLEKRDLGAFAVVETVAPKDCRGDGALTAGHYEATLFARQAYAKHLFDPALSNYRESRQASDNS